MRQLFILFFLCFSATLHATPPDSLGVKIIGNTKYILHEVEEAEGFYGIGRRYNADVKTIQLANPDLEQGLTTGDIVLVPFNAIKQTLPVPVIPANTKTHTVQQKETLFSISRMYKIAVGDLRQWNELAHDTLKIGQVLLLEPGKNTAPDDSPITANTEDTLSLPKPVDTTRTSPRSYVVPSPYQDQFLQIERAIGIGEKYEGLAYAKFTESGVAGWIDEGSIVSDKFLALHSTAPPGTIIKVRNMMNGHIVFVKVVAPLPDNSRDPSIIKITKSAADKLGVLDARFRVDLFYNLKK